MIYNVIIVDDNKSTVKSLCNLDLWKTFECEIIDVAYTGFGALQICKNHHVDIIVTDIKMPGMDGLTFTEKIRKINPDAIVILISGCDEFALAKKALELGAFQYILKPINDDEIFQCVQKAVNQLKQKFRKESSDKRIIDNYNRLSLENLKYTKKNIKNILNDLLHNYIVNDTEINNLYQSSFNNFNSFQLIIINKVGDMQKISLSNLIEKIDHITSKYKDDTIDTMISTVYDNSICLLIFFNEEKTNHKVLENLCNQIINDFEPLTNLVCGISRQYSGKDKLNTALEEAIYAVNLRYFLDKKNVIFADSHCKKNFVSQHSVMKKAYAIYAILNGANGNIDKAINDVFSEITRIHDIGVKEVKNILICICSNVFQIYCDNIIYAKDEIELSNIYENIRKSQTIAEAKQYINVLIKDIYSKMQNKKLSAYSKTVADIMDYLNNNYNKKLSLNDISERFELSTSHICRLLKKETGSTFTNLFNKIKIKNADRLLHETNLKVYEIANEVGIENYAYFYQIYRKITGKTPTQQ